MIDKSNYMTNEEIEVLENDIAKQVSSLKENLLDKSKFRKKSINVSVVKTKVGDEDVDE